MTEPQYVRSPDGTRLAVYGSGSPERPTLVLIHGYPDNHTVWDGVVAELGGRFHVARYDVRGAGASDQPAGRAAYRMPRLVEDLRAVIDDVSPDRPVHLIGHDWGSIQTWAAVTDPALRSRIASYTSISGPSLDHVASWMRTAGIRRVLRQLLHSYYIALFQIPGLPELAWRSGLSERILRRTSRIGATPGSAAMPERSLADKINGIRLYRANMLPRLARPVPLPTEVPVQVIAPRHDPFVEVEVQTQAPRPWVADLRVHEIDAGHWVVCDRPAEIASLITAFVDEIEAANQSPVTRSS